MQDANYFQAPQTQKQIFFAFAAQFCSTLPYTKPQRINANIKIRQKTQTTCHTLQEMIHCYSSGTRVAAKSEKKEILL